MKPSPIVKQLRYPGVPWSCSGLNTASSWDKLMNLKVKDTTGKVKVTMGKDKGKSQATDPEQNQEDDQWAFEPNPEPTRQANLSW